MYLDNYAAASHLRQSAIGCRPRGGIEGCCKWVGLGSDAWEAVLHYCDPIPGALIFSGFNEDEIRMAMLFVAEAIESEGA